MVGYCGKIILFALIYYVTGRLGLLLAVPPGYATAMWPPSGFALAGILLFGYRYWPGIFLGSAAVNLFTSFDPSNTSSILLSYIIAAIIAGGAVLQSLFGAWLCRRWIKIPNPLEQFRDIGLLLLLGGPTGCLINSVISENAGKGVRSKFSSNTRICCVIPAMDALGCSDLPITSLSMCLDL